MVYGYNGGRFRTIMLPSVVALSLDLDRSDNSDITKLTWARIAARCDITGEAQLLYWSCSAKTIKEGEGKLFSPRFANQRHNYPILEN